MRPEKAEEYLRRIRLAGDEAGRVVRLMEVCGTHTHAIGRGGLRAVLPATVELVSGPGCPVCVTSQRDVERMLLLARIPGVTVCTFGDMLRVPGVSSSLEKERARGADVRVVYSPLDALETARREPGQQVAFLAVGFETTAPGVAAVMLRARDERVGNFSAIVTHKLILPAMEAVLDGGSNIDGFLTPGHVSVIIGADAYEELAGRRGIPCVATGFEPIDVLEGIAMLLELIGQGRGGSFIQYRRAVKRKGNEKAWGAMMEAFRITDGEWRGIGVIPGSGLKLRDELSELDAEKRFNLPELEPVELRGCRCGEVLKGMIHPPECPLFGKVCTPASPVGPCMVSSEGSCAARYRYG
ncbi:MAG TPA: hydrogenase formation protein HypD [Candidatus Brocadiia bacterium]|nr:hydrogenase formation protein HypD [Candidatus Brocadiia bacterium]